MEILSIPVLVAIIEMIKMAGLPSKYAPIVSVTIGILLGLLFSGVTTQGFGDGLIIGLSASGLYSAGKAVSRK